ncbi:hypothetical protein KALB_4955 [Kutzneria albida DSM 43870]|uniref:Uncharacterized protein n=2 Tax=Kutzneria TaxID=43356 RepID=W5WBQ5_9PSEU|nr:hypothetical protein KALB_4955 [Kutzneria albida DSM 43870]
MPPASDLTHRILVAIASVERSENAKTTLGQPELAKCPVCTATLGTWSRHDGVTRSCFTRQTTSGPVYYEDPCRCPLTHEQWLTTCNAKPSPDLAVLRRCTADRRIIVRHKPGTGIAADDTSPDGLRDIEYCATCTMGNGCDHCISEQDGDYEPWPCATLKDIAVGYGITVDGAA